MQVQLRFFASLREALGPQLTLDLPDGACVAQARDTLIQRGEPFASALGRHRGLRSALNQALCEESASLQPGDELAFFPPVTGG